ncbi:phage baseplate assembly protein V [Vibrio quintilis]|uniref:Phage-related baseplate assembly protein n=1 Tax=Vibrio quintilis TaxID=1117707 RepID=A0A1M7YYY4_9VIBR|nr:phage baseplate assembly protein V [Vibrio quintilis]SHO57762.1 Phage-related baseplate assembly protein [Vibrio quintilis]
MESYRISELERQLHGLIRLCTVTELGNGGQVKVQDGELNSTWLDRAVDRAGENRAWHPLDVGEQVVVLCPSGDLTMGIIIASLYQDQHPAPSSNEDLESKVFKDGSVISYDRKSHQYLIDIKGADATVDVISAGTLNIKTSKNIQVQTSADAKVSAQGNVNVSASKIALNGGSPCVTTAHICHFTGKPHGDGSRTVTAGK